MLRKVFAVFALLAFATAASAQETIVVYFAKGFYPAEDKAVDELIDKFQKKTGVKVELSRYAPQEMIPKTVAALDAGSPPDVVYGDVFDFQVAGKWAYEGRLEDLSDILTPMKSRFLPNTLETTFMYNDKTKKRAYYAFPVKRQTMHIQYWKDMLARPTSTSGAARRRRATARRPASASTRSAARWASIPPTRSTRS